MTDIKKNLIYTHKSVVEYNSQEYKLSKTNKEEKKNDWVSCL